MIGTTRRHMIRLENGEHLPGIELRDRIVEAAGAEKSSVQSSDDDEEAVLPPDLDRALQTLARYVGARTA